MIRDTGGFKITIDLSMFCWNQVTGNKALQGKSAEPDPVFKIITKVYSLATSAFCYDSSS